MSDVVDTDESKVELSLFTECLAYEFGTYVVDDELGIVYAGALPDFMTVVRAITIIGHFGAVLDGVGLDAAVASIAQASAKAQSSSRRVTSRRSQRQMFWRRRQHLRSYLPQYRMRSNGLSTQARGRCG